MSKPRFSQQTTYQKKLSQIRNRGTKTLKEEASVEEPISLKTKEYSSSVLKEWIERNVYDYDQLNKYDQEEFLNALSEFTTNIGDCFVYEIYEYRSQITDKTIYEFVDAVSYSTYQEYENSKNFKWNYTEQVCKKEEVFDELDKIEEELEQIR